MSAKESSTRRYQTAVLAPAAVMTPTMTTTEQNVESLQAENARLKSDMAELAASMLEVIRISDRKTDVWDVAKAILAKVARAQTAEQPEHVMCPNCVTPWKCNGPHVPEQPEHTERE